MIRSIFKFAYDNGHIENRLRYGQEFQKPSDRVMEEARNKKPKKMFEADEIHVILNATDPIIKAMVLLGINCGYENTDIATLPQTAVDFDKSLVEFPRKKTEIKRSCP